MFCSTLREFSLRSQRRAAVLLVAVGVPTILLALQSVRVAASATLGEASDIPKLRWAVALDRGNAGLQHRLGMVFFYAAKPLDAAQGLAHLRLATELNPRVALYWLDLSAACESTGDSTCADHAFARALELGPLTPRIRWAAANHELRAGRTEAALARLRELLAIGPEYAAPSFRLGLQVVDDPRALFDTVLADADPGIKLAYVNFLSSSGRADSAHEVWLQIAAQHSSLPLAAVEPYLERLLDQGRTEEALNVWQEVEKRGGMRAVRNDTENLIFNGGFEQPPLDAGFDWRLRPPRELAVDCSDPSAGEGLRCLRLDFAVRRNAEYEPVYQLVPVTPHRPYMLTALARSEAITSDSGPRLRVLDPACPSCLDVSTETTVGTMPWHTVSLRFSAGAQTRFVRVSVWRPRSRTFPTEITGRFWLDAVSLKPQQEPIESAQRH